MIHIGLTGGIASGKSTVAALFQSYHIPVFDADATVHQLYQQPSVMDIIQQYFPKAVTHQGVDRNILSLILRQTPSSIRTLNHIIHPLVRQKEQAFIQFYRRLNHQIILTDIPLMVENNTCRRYDVKLMAYAPIWLRKQRALKRSSSMTEAKWQLIIDKQATDIERKKQMDGIIYTSLGYDKARKQVKEWVHRLKEL